MPNNRKGLKEMENNMVTIINTMTNSHIEDDPRFDQVIDHHFEKFRHFYSLLCDELQDVADLDCECSDDRLSLSIEVTLKGKGTKRIQSIYDRIKSAETEYSQYFNTVLTVRKESLNISIENNYISGESEIHGIGSYTD